MKKITRLTALMLVLLMLCSLTVSATESTGGISLEDLDAAAWNAIVEAATESEENSGTEEEAELDLSQCGNYICEYTLHMMNECATAQERYDYLMSHYTAPEDIPEGEETSEEYLTLEYILLHYYTNHIVDQENMTDSVVCICEFPIIEPEYVPGDLSMHTNEACPWHFNNLRFGEQYDVVSQAANAEDYLALMSEEDKEKLSRVNVTDYTAEATNANVAINVAEGTFAEDYILSAAGIELDEAKLSVLDGENAVGSFDISFANLYNEAETMQPAAGNTVTLTFTVNTAAVEGDFLQVYHFIANGDGTYTAEAVGKVVALDKTVETQTITVQADAFSTYTVAGGIFGECTDENCFYINEYAAMTTLEKYAYLMGDLYTVDGTAMEVFMAHIAGFHSEAPQDICTCYVPVYAPGSSAHEETCPWYGVNATAAEHYAVYTKLSLPHKACYLLGMDEAQLNAIRAEMTDAEQAEMPYLLEDGIPNYLRTEEVEAWLAHNKAVTAEMAVLAKDATDNGMALNQALKVDSNNELLWLWEGEPMATITENGYIVDNATGIVVGRYDFENGTFTMGTGAN